MTTPWGRITVNQPLDAAFSLQGKRFLLTHTLVHKIMGSTVMTFEMAEFLSSQGAEVTVFAGYRGWPASEWFEALGVDVVTDPHADLHLGDFDYVWVNSQVLPAALAEQLAADPLDTAPCFLFNHMSSLPYAPDEHPYLYGLEERLASASIYVAEETRTKLARFFDHAPPGRLYPNPAPTRFCDLQRDHPTHPRRFLIVSNHHAPEVQHARTVLEERGCEVVHFGQGREEYGLVTPEVLAAFDVVVTIGKTVQYCLVSGTPVFVYDHFGGFGYLNGENVEDSAWHNFSGRGGVSRSGEEIVAELFDGYEAAVQYQNSMRAAFIDRYSIAAVLPRLLASVEPRTLDPLPEPFAAALSSAQTFGHRAYRTWGAHDDARVRIHDLEHEVSVLQDETARLTSLVDQILQSRSFRLGYAALKPLMPVYKRLRGRELQ